MAKKEVTIYDIAKEANVSPATVSRVLTGSVNVRKEKKDRVSEVIRKYNYRPNPLARGLSDTKTKIIGILTADIRNPFYAAVFIACEQAAMDRGYTLMLFNSLNHKELEEHYLDKFEEQRVDGVVLVGGRVDELVSDINYVDHVNRLSNKIPVVVTGRLDGSDTYQVNLDQIHGVETIMEYLIGLGHKKIALLGGSVAVKSTVEKRLRYKQLLDRHGLPYNEKHVSKDGSYDDIVGYEEMSKLLKSDDIPTAVIAINDYTAIGVIKAIYEVGLRIPEDISVAAFDNTFISMMSSPQLTSIDYNYEEFGKKLISTVIDIIEKNDIPRVQHISTKLIVRDSCSAPK